MSQIFEDLKETQAAYNRSLVTLGFLGLITLGFLAAAEEEEAAMRDEEEYEDEDENPLFPED